MTEQAKRTRTQEPDAAESVQSFIEQASVAGREYSTVANGAALEGLRTAFALQNEGLKATATIFEASVHAATAVGGAWMAAIRQGQQAAATLAAAGVKLAETSTEASTATQ